MFLIRRTRAAVVIMAGVVTSFAAAQCPWTWTDGFERNGGPGENVWDSVVFNDGSGDALFICTDPGRVYKFDGLRWQKIGHAYGNATGVAGGFTYKLAVADPDGPGPLDRQLFVTGLFRRMLGPVGLPVTAYGVARWDGSSWTGEGSSQMQAVVIRAATAFDDGGGEKLVVGGAFAVGSGRGIAIRDFNGSWSLVGEGLGGYLGTSSEVNALHAFDDGNGMALYVAGLFESIGNVPSPGVIKWTGSAWLGLGAGVQYTTGEGGRVYGLSSFNDGTGPKLYASGNIASSGGDTTVRGVAKWDGSTWSGMGADFVVGRFGPYVRNLDLGSGPTLFLNGQLGTMAAQGIAQWSGSAWTSPGWDAVLLGQPLSINAFDVDGAGPHPKRLIALPATPYQYDTVSWQRLPYHPGSNAISSVNQLAVLDLDGPGPQASALVATTSSLTAANGQTVNRLGTFDGSAWSPVLGGLPNLERRDINDGSAGPDAPTCAQMFDDGSGLALYVGGGFNFNDAIKACRIMKWNGSAFVEIGGGIGEVVNNGHSVTTMAVYDEPGPDGPALYACGSFVLAGTTAVSNIARWDGSSWTDVGTGVGGPVSASAVFDDGSGPSLYVAGSFTTAGGNPASYIARWNGTAWTDVGGGLSASANALLVHNDGTGPALYASGTFATAGGVTVNRIAKWDGTAWTALANGMARGPGVTGTATVRSLASLTEDSANVLIAGGTFELAGGSTVNHVARWDGSTWSAMEGGVGVISGTPNVTNLAVVNIGTRPSLFASGTLDFAGTRSAGSFARWTSPLGCCPADLDDGAGSGQADGGVDINDLLYFLAQFEAGSAAVDLDNGTFTGTPDGGVDINDLLFFLVHFEAGC